MPLASIAARLALSVLAAAALVSAAGAHAQGADRIASRPVPAVVDGRLEVAAAAGRGVLPVHVSRDWSVPQPEVVRAVIVVPGYTRDDLRAGEAAMKRAGDGARAAMVVVPQFLIPADVAAHRLPADTLRWNVRDWKSGEPALGPAPLSAFDGLDAIVARLGDRRLFPQLRTIVVAGHSAGAHLAAMMMAAVWPAYDPALPADLVKGGILMSGIYDLAPVLHTDFVNADLKLTTKDIEPLSPAGMPKAHDAPFITAVGGLESDEFKRQTGLLAQAWKQDHKDDIPLPDANHMTICDAFGTPGSALHEATVGLMSDAFRR